MIRECSALSLDGGLEYTRGYRACYTSSSRAHKHTQDVRERVQACRCSEVSVEDLLQLEVYPIELAWRIDLSVTDPSLPLCLTGLCLLELAEALAGYV